MELSFHLLDTPLPHLSPIFKIYNCKTGNPARTRRTGSKQSLSTHTSRGPALPGPVTWRGKHNQHLNSYFSPFYPPRKFCIICPHLLKRQKTSERSSPFPVAQGASQPSLISLRAEKTVDFSIPSSCAILLPAAEWTVRASTYPRPPTHLLWIYLSLRSRIITSKSHHSVSTLCGSDFLLRAFPLCMISLNLLKHSGRQELLSPFFRTN